MSYNVYDDVRELSLTDNILIYQQSGTQSYQTYLVVFALNSTGLSLFTARARRAAMLARY